jgi:hypothetical protein
MPVLMYTLYVLETDYISTCVHLRISRGCGFCFDSIDRLVNTPILDLDPRGYRVDGLQRHCDDLIGLHDIGLDGGERRALVVGALTNPSNSHQDYPGG